MMVVLASESYSIACFSSRESNVLSLCLVVFHFPSLCNTGSKYPLGVVCGKVGPAYIWKSPVCQ